MVQINPNHQVFDTRTERYYVDVMCHVFDQMRYGRLRIDAVDGREFLFKGTFSGPEVSIKVLDYDFFRQCAERGDLGVAQSYLDGLWDSNDLESFLQWVIVNMKDYIKSGVEQNKNQSSDFLKILSNMYTHLVSISESQVDVDWLESLDIESRLYAMVLDNAVDDFGGLSQSMARLKRAQNQMCHQFSEQLKPHRDDLLLEINSGFGGFAFHVNKTFGSRVTTITGQESRYERIKRTILDRNLHQDVVMKQIDFQHIEDQFDKMIAIKILKHETVEQWPGFLKRVGESLLSGGQCLVYCLIQDDFLDSDYEQNMSLYQKHLFPKALWPAMGFINKCARKIEGVRVISHCDYSQQRLNSIQEQIEVLKNSDQQTLETRKWFFYKSYVSAAYQTKSINEVSFLIGKD